MKARTLPRRGMKSIVLAAVGSLMLAGFAHADLYPNLTIQFYSSTDGKAKDAFNAGEWSSVQKMGETSYLFDGGLKSNKDKWELDWSILVNPTMNKDNTAGPGGAFINLANLAVTNTTGTNQIFFVLVTLALDTPILGPTLSKGDVAASIQSFVGQGATLKNISKGAFAGDPIYEAFIDGVSVATLMDDPTAITSTGFQTASATDEFGHPVPIATGPALNNISIWLKIEVSAQSIATVIGLFEVIPAPSAFPLLALGVFGIRRRRRN